MNENNNRELLRLIRSYVVSRREPAISVSLASRAVGGLPSASSMNGRALDNAIAACALAEGYAVLFDRSPEM